MSSYIDKEIKKPNTPVAQTVPMAPTPPPIEPTSSLGKKTEQDKAEQIMVDINTQRDNHHQLGKEIDGARSELQQLQGSSFLWTPWRRSC